LCGGLIVTSTLLVPLRVRGTVCAAFMQRERERGCHYAAHFLGSRNIEWHRLYCFRDDSVLCDVLLLRFTLLVPNGLFDSIVELRRYADANGEHFRYVPCQ
jgi:hypothetical protein